MQFKSRIRTLFLFLVISGLLVLTGCGASGVVVQGRLVSDGQPYEVNEEKEDLQVIFVNGTEKLKSYPATLREDGTFLVSGPDGGGIPPGSYRIMVQSFPYGGDLGHSESEENQGDKFRGKFSAEKTPLNVEISATETSEITIDLKKGTVTR